jgi:hypothetical protein
MIHIQNKKTNHVYLCYTSLLLIIPFLHFVSNQHQKPFIECILASLIVPTTLLSQLFWINPIKHSIIHKIDAIVAKITIASFIIYTFLYKFTYSYLIVVTVGTTSFYFSNFYSTQEWCSNKHLCYHGSLHILCVISTFYTFTPILM